MKRSGFKRQALTPAQRQLKAAWREAKSSLKTKGRKRVSSRKCFYKGIRFDSQWEREVYQLLEARQQSGEIADLKTHQVITFGIENEAGKTLILQINIDFEYFDVRLKRNVRADAKPPKKLDRQKEAWFLRWRLLSHMEPDYLYQIHRPYTWRDIGI